MSDFDLRKSVVIMEDNADVVSPSTAVTFQASLFSAAILVGNVQQNDPCVFVSIENGKVFLSLHDGRDDYESHNPIALFVLTPDGKWQQQST